MRNVRSALLVAAVGLMGLTACSFSSSRSWGSGNGSTANPNGHGSTGKPAKKSTGKPAKKVADNSKPASKEPTPAPVATPTPEPTPAPAPVPEAEPTRVGREDGPTRVPRADDPTTASVGVNSTTLSAKATKPEPKPTPSGTIGVASTPTTSNPGTLKAAPVKPTAPTNKAAK